MVDSGGDGKGSSEGKRGWLKKTAGPGGENVLTGLMWTNNKTVDIGGLRRCRSTYEDKHPSPAPS